MVANELLGITMNHAKELREYAEDCETFMRHPTQRTVKLRKIADHIEEVEAELAEATASNMAVEQALEDVPYKGTYADGVLFLKAERDNLQKIVDEYRDTFPRVQNQRNAFERKCDDWHDERDALAAQCQMMREALYAISTGSFPTVQDVFNVAHKSLATPDTSAEVLARRDAAVWLEAADFIDDTWDDSVHFCASALRAKHDELMKGVEG